MRFTSHFILSALCALTICGQANAADQNMKAILGQQSSTLAAESKHTYTIDLQENEGVSVTFAIGTGTSQTCYDDIDLDLISSEGIGLVSDAVGFLNENKAENVLHAIAQSEKAGTYSVEIVRSIGTSTANCADSDFPYDITFKTYQGQLELTKAIEATSQTYSDELLPLDTHEYFFTLGKKTKMTAKMSAKADVQSSCYSDLEMQLFDADGFVVADANEYIINDTFSSSPAEIEYDNKRKASYRLLLTREINESDERSRECTEAAYEYNLALSVPGAKICTLNDIKKKCRKKARRKCKKRNASNMKACIKPIKKRCTKRGNC